MRIAFHSPRAAFFDPAILGGDAVFVQNLVASLRSRGHDVKVVSRLDPGTLSAYRLIREALVTRRRMHRFSPDAWLTYGASSTYPDLFGWWLHHQRYVLFAVGDGRPDTLPTRFRLPFWIAHRLSLARAHAAFVERPKGAARLTKLGVSPERIHICPAPPRSFSQVPTREEARRRLGLPTGASVLLCMGRFPEPSASWHCAKTGMVLHLIDAVAKLPPGVVLLVVGDDGHGQAAVEREIARRGLDRRVRVLGVEERIRLLGSLDNEHVKWFYAACDLYVYPHAVDRPWLSLLEAQACGRPVLTLLHPSTELIVDAGRTGILAKDLQEFQQALGALCSDPARREAMGRTAREYVRRRHSMELRVQEIEQALRGTSTETAVTAPSRATIPG